MCVGSNWLRAGGKSASLDDSVHYITLRLFSSVEEIYTGTIFVIGWELAIVDGWILFLFSYLNIYLNNYQEGEVKFDEIQGRNCAIDILYLWFMENFLNIYNFSIFLLYPILL